MIVQTGHVDVGGTIAYVPQSPWVQNLSLKDNILFGMPYDEAKYKAVIHACALELDLKILPNGKPVGQQLLPVKHLRVDHSVSSNTVPGTFSALVQAAVGSAAC